MGQLRKKENQQFTELLLLYYNVRDLPCHDFFDCITAKTAVSTEAGYERMQMRRKGQRKIVKFAALFLAAALLGAAPAQASGVQVNPTIRVGIFFGGNALPGANLLNHVGSGYRFGYFDSGLNFIQLGFTGETAISMVKTQNVWYHEGQYTDAAGSGPAVGCYHLLLPGSYPDFQSAQAAAALYSGGFPAWIDGVYQVRVGAYLDGGSAKAAQAALGLGTKISDGAYAVRCHGRYIHIDSDTDSVIYKVQRSALHTDHNYACRYSFFKCSLYWFHSYEWNRQPAGVLFY